MRLKLFWICAGLTAIIVMPVSAQRGGVIGGLGVGHVAGPVTGPVNETVHGRGTVDSTVNGPGARHDAGRSALDVTQNAQLSERLQTLLPAQGSPCRPPRRDLRTKGSSSPPCTWRMT
jgi:hypothetical protein